MLGLAQTSNKIIQKRLAFAPKQSATDTVPSAETRSGILPRRLDGRGGASVVAATDAAEPKEIAMPKAKSKRRTPSPSNRSRTAGRNRAPRTTAHKSGKLKAGNEVQCGSAAPIPCAADRTHRKQADPDHCDAASTKRRDRGRDGARNGLAAAFGPWLSRRRHPQKAKP
jgi:hypothetical protein